jgi:opacity protein-like surface antigen
MIRRSATLAAALLLAGIGSAYAADASGEVAYVDAQHKTMGLVGGPEFALTDAALAKVEGVDWEGRHVIVVYQEKDGQNLASDVVLTGTDLQQRKRQNLHG